MTSRKRFLEFTGSGPSPSPRSSLGRPPATTPLSLFSVHQREKMANLARQGQMTSPAPSVTASLSAISSETRRMLRELERRSSPVNAGKRMKLDVCTSFASSYRSQDSEMSSPSSSCSTKPPVSSLATPYRAHVLPRLATLNKAPYARPVKHMVDVGVSVDFTSNESASLSTYKTATKLKTVGGSRNKFTAFDVDQDDFEVLHNEDLSRLPRLPLHSAPLAGFFSSVASPSEPRRSSSPSSPTPDTFAFSYPKVVANPPLSSTNRMDLKSDYGGFLQTPLRTQSETAKLPSPNGDEIAKTVAQPSKTATQPSKTATQPQVHCKTMPLLTVTSSSPIILNGPSSQKPQVLVNGGTAAYGRSVDRLDLLCEKLADPFKPTVDATKWTCETCWIKNDIKLTKCAACQMEKTVIQSGNSSNAKNTESHPWYCTTCYISNASNLNNCCACGSARPGHTKVAHEFKPMPVDLKSDKKAQWSCTICFVSNPDEKLKCLACQAAKPGSNFKPISFGFKPTNVATPTQSSTIGVQCVTLGDSTTSTSPSTVSLGFPTANLGDFAKTTFATVNQPSATLVAPMHTAKFGFNTAATVNPPTATVAPSSTVSFGPTTLGTVSPQVASAAPTSTVSFGLSTFSTVNSKVTTAASPPTVSFGIGAPVTVNPSLVTTTAPPSTMSFGLSSLTAAKPSATTAAIPSTLSFGLNAPATVSSAAAVTTAPPSISTVTPFGFPPVNFGSSVKNTSATVTSTTATLPPSTFSFGSTTANFLQQPPNGTISSTSNVVPTAAPSSASFGLNSLATVNPPKTTAAPNSTVSVGFPVLNFGASAKNYFSSTIAPASTAAPPTKPFSFGALPAVPSTTSGPATSTAGFSFSLGGPTPFAPQPAAPSISGQSIFGFSTGDPAAAFAPSAGGLGLGTAAVSSAPQTTAAASTANQPTFGFWGAATPATTIASSTSPPSFGQQPQMNAPVNMFNLTSKSATGGIPGRRTLTAKRKGK